MNSIPVGVAHDRGRRSEFVECIGGRNLLNLMSFDVDSYLGVIVDS